MSDRTCRIYIARHLTRRGAYKTPTGWETAKTRREEIKFRQNPLSPATETEIMEVTETRNGVIVTEEAEQKFALKWTALDPKNQEFEAFFALNRAKNWEDFQTALKTYGGATQNFVYADTRRQYRLVRGGKNSDSAEGRRRLAV